MARGDGDSKPRGDAGSSSLGDVGSSSGAFSRGGVLELASESFSHNGALLGSLNSSAPARKSIALAEDVSPAEVKLP